MQYLAQAPSCQAASHWNRMLKPHVLSNYQLVAVLGSFLENTASFRNGQGLFCRPRSGPSFLWPGLELQKVDFFLVTQATTKEAQKKKGQTTQPSLANSFWMPVLPPLAPGPQLFYLRVGVLRLCFMRSFRTPTGLSFRSPL